MITIKKKGGITASILADSVSTHGDRITTFELEYPRFIHSEFMTHRLFSRNAASSRAIPVNKSISLVLENTARPIHWGKNQPGMSAKEECFNEIHEEAQLYFSNGDQWVRHASAEYVLNSKFIGVVDALPEKAEPFTYCLLSTSSHSRENWWNLARDSAISFATQFTTSQYHKQIVNRLLEPFTMIKVVLTATEYDNFFHLRAHPDAQPEIQELATAMYEAIKESIPVKLDHTQWHMPYYRSGFWNSDMPETLEDALKISSSCCAQVSYRVLNDTLEKAEDIYTKLIESKPCHASPTEHQARPFEHVTINTARFFDGSNWERGATHVDRAGKFWSGNFSGWVQHRQLIPGHVFEDKFKM